MTTSQCFRVGVYSAAYHVFCPAFLPPSLPPSFSPYPSSSLPSSPPPSPPSLPPPLPRSEWGEWEEAQQPVFCLFCPTGSASQRTALEHMKACAARVCCDWLDGCDALSLSLLQLAHDFDFRSVCVKLQLDYYAQVKAVNFIRRQVCACVCSEKFGCSVQLLL